MSPLGDARRPSACTDWGTLANPGLEQWVEQIGPRDRRSSMGAGPHGPARRVSGRSSAAVMLAQ